MAVIFCETFDLTKEVIARRMAALLEADGSRHESRAIVGSGTKIKWTVAPTHEQLPIEKCFALAESSEAFEACAFRPQELLNANRGDGYKLTFQDFFFHNGDYVTPKGSGFGSPNPDGSRERWTWKCVTFSREDVLRV